MSFKLNKAGIAQIAAGDGMRAHMQKIANDTAKAIESQAPPIVRKGGQFFGRVTLVNGAWQAEAGVRSTFWHWPEFGTSGRHFRSPQPYIRPAAQQILTRYGGRFSTTRK